MFAITMPNHCRPDKRSTIRLSCTHTCRMAAQTPYPAYGAVRCRPDKRSAIRLSCTHTCRMAAYAVLCHQAHRLSRKIRNTVSSPLRLGLIRIA
ncbi:hypothetical protein FOT48_16420 [Citrobacter koseri]|nr:hypothetical protein [Citrobacter koseri]MBE0083390.1 hypothetical protein [Citrobacter koseri]